MALIPMPKSKFLLVKCKKCKSEQVVFNKASTIVKCTNCGNELVNPTGGDAHIKSKIVKVLS
jgi:small subunit ribosomal protein S27e